MLTKKNGLIECAFLLLVVPMAVVLTRMPANPVWLKVLQQLLGLWGFLLLTGQFILSSRLHTLEAGIGLDRLLHTHRFTGIATLICLGSHYALFLLHAVLYNPGYRPNFMRDWPVFLGSLLFLIVVVISVSALFWKKFHMRYESWKRIHFAAYAIPPIILIHIFLLGTNTKSSLVLKVLVIAAALGYAGIVVVRLQTYFRKRRSPFQVSHVIKQTGDIVSLRFSGGYPLQYQPGQFAILTLIRNGVKDSPHPFTLSSSPHQDFLEFSIKGCGDFTQTIGTTQKGDLAYIEGPYGNFSCLTDQRLTHVKESVMRTGGVPDHQLADVQELVFLAGGIGITPCLSMMRYLHDQQSSLPILLCWGNKTVQDVGFCDELRAFAEKHEQWRIVHALSREKSDWTPGFGEVVHGRVNGKLVSTYVPDVGGRHFFICGPAVFRDALVQDLHSRGVAAPNVHFELFSW